MSAASVTAYLSPTMARKRAINSGESGGAGGWTKFIFRLLRALFPPHPGAAQPGIDGFTQPVMRHRHDRDRARAFGVERAKITEKIGCGFPEIPMCGQIHHHLY